MPHKTCDGAKFLAAFRSAVANLAAHVDEVNALNVFPVPDGDTGTNMLATVRAALDAGDALRPGDEAAAGGIAHAIANGALMGARGNSGVITSQILGGIAHALDGKRRFNGLDLAHALESGTKKAYAAVQRPVEGTILTVIREASAAAIAAAEQNNDAEFVLAATVEAAERAVAKTPQLLDVLREAKVVDPGGQGLFRLLEGAPRLRAACPSPARTPRRSPSPSRSRASGGPSSSASRRRRPTATRPSISSMRARARRWTSRRSAPISRASATRCWSRAMSAWPRSISTTSARTPSSRTACRWARSPGSPSRTSTGRPATSARRAPQRSSRTGRVLAAQADFAGAMAHLMASSVATASSSTPLQLTRMPLGVVVVAPSDGLAQRLAETAEGFQEYVAFRVVHGGQTANCPPASCSRPSRTALPTSRSSCPTTPTSSSPPSRSRR
ncbi:MAG: DAK2 domain-containing protein [Chloroflexota bacterium]